jgi:hypothetical protein
MEPPDLNQILMIGNNPGPDGLWLQGIVKKSGEHDNGRIWAQVWYNDVRASYVGFVEWREPRWIFSDPSVEELHHEWKSAIENMITVFGCRGLPTNPSATASMNVEISPKPQPA